MNDLDRNILDLKGKMDDKKRIKQKLDKMFKQRMELNKRKTELKEALRREELDVEKLEGMSFVNIFHSIIGDKGEKLEKEKQEALAAKLKYDSACREIEALDNDIERQNRRLDQLKDIEEIYEKLIKEKQDRLTSFHSEAGEILNRLHDKEEKALSKEKEVGEAIEAGEELLHSLYRVKDYLQSAGAWGTWDILGGGFISTMAKHSKIDSARNEISIAQRYLRNFHRELQDVGTSMDIDIEIGSFLTFADYFFDGLFSDLAVQSKIDRSKLKVESTIQDVRYMLNKLRKEMKETEREREVIIRKKQEVIENSCVE